jgi:hypothetical protein
MLFKPSLHLFIGKLTKGHTYSPNLEFCTQIKKKLCYKTWEVTWEVPSFTSNISKVLPPCNLLSFLPPCIKTNHSSPLKESCRNKVSKLQIKNYVRKERDKWSKFALLKRRGKKDAREDHTLVAFKRFHAWLSLEGKDKTSFSSPSIFHPIKLYLNLFSPWF